MNASQSRRAKAAAAFASIISVALAAGCADSGQAWSTKQDSIFTFGEPTLNAPQFAVETVAGYDRQNLRRSAIRLLDEASLSQDPVLRANAIEAMHYAPERLDPFVRRGLVDDNRGVRFIAAMTLGKFQMKDLAHLARPLLLDESQSVKAAAIYALHRCGEQVDLNPLADMLRSSNPEVKANAALIIGELGNRSAAPMLRNAVGRNMERVSPARAQVVDLQLAEAMVKLGDERQLEVIRASLFAPAEQGEIVALACLMAGRIGDVRAMANLHQLATRTGQRQLPAEVRMAAALAMAQIDPAEAPVDVPLEFVRSERFEHRAQAALTLGAMSDAQSLPTLARLLSDSNPMVQVFAAGGLLQHDQVRMARGEGRDDDLLDLP